MIIEAKQKSVNANTLYYSISAADKREILNVLTEFLALTIEAAQHDKELRTSIWAAVRDLPRGSNGMNSPCSFVAGLIAQHVENARRDFSSRQLDGLDILLPNICSALGRQTISIRRT